jgi:hypothetical protein
MGNRTRLRPQLTRRRFIFCIASLPTDAYCHHSQRGSGVACGTPPKKVLAFDTSDSYASAMASGQDLVATVRSLLNNTPGLHYENTSDRRCHPDQSPHEVDCSGLVSWALTELGVGHGCENSWGQAQRCHAAHTGLTIDDALHTPGALLFQGANEGQTSVNNRGHIAIALGDGVHTAEARGHIAGVGIFNGLGRNWDYAAMPPDITPGPGPGVPPPPANNDEELEVHYLPGQPDATFRPIGLSCIGGTIFVWNVTANPFKEGTLNDWPNAHILTLPLAPQEDILGVTDRTPSGQKCPESAPIEVITNLPGDGQARHILHRR